MAERAKLSCAPVGIWDKQVFAGCFTLREERIVNTYALPEFAYPEEQKEGENMVLVFTPCSAIFHLIIKGC